jgi:lysine-N-methylase
MPVKKRIFLQPEYLSRFTCIAGACEDSCCTGGWGVFVDKKTYLKYRDLKDAELKQALDKVMKRYRGKDVSAQQYALFRMRVDGGCVFLNAQGRCHIIDKIGAENLCDVCAVYPRIYGMVDKKLERCATMSCPEIVRLALTNPDGIVFETVEENLGASRVPARVPSLDSSNTKFAAKPAKFFWDIRLYCLSILQNRLYPLGQRLIILGMLYQKIEVLDKASRIEDIPAMLETFSAEIENGSLKPSLDLVETNFQIQMRLAKELTDERLKGMKLTASRNYIECVKETLVGLECFVDTPIDDILKKFIENREEYVVPYMKEKDYVMENFLVNEFFMRMMPFGSGESCWESYLHLCVLYSMVKLHINGMAGFHKGLTDETVFRLIQAFSKVVMHNKQFVSNMVKLLKETGTTRLPGWRLWCMIKHSVFANIKSKSENIKSKPFFEKSKHANGI